MWGEMMTFIEAIRETIAEALNSALLVEVIYATYTSDGLVTDQSQTPIPLGKTDIPLMLTQKGITLECPEVQGGKLTLKAPLADGDRVAVIAHHRRQRFSILYKV